MNDMEETTNQLKKFLDSLQIPDSDVQIYLPLLIAQGFEVSDLLDVREDQLLSIGIKIAHVNRMLKHAKKCKKCEVTETIEHSSHDPFERINKLEHEIVKLKEYRMIFDILLVGEAAAELAECKNKPKAAIKRPGDREVIWDSAPARKAPRPMEDRMKTHMNDWKEGKNYLSHLMKQHRVDPEYLRVVVEDLISTRAELKNVGSTAPD